MKNCIVLSGTPFTFIHVGDAVLLFPNFTGLPMEMLTGVSELSSLIQTTRLDVVRNTPQTEPNVFYHAIKHSSVFSLLYC